MPIQATNIFAGTDTGFVYNPVLANLDSDIYAAMLANYPSIMPQSGQISMPVMPAVSMPQMPIFGGFLTGANLSTQTRSSGSSVSCLPSGAISGSAQKIVQIAQQELAKGVKENGGNNDSVDIRRYKHGAVNGHQWCAYFTSYCCEQAGAKPFNYTGSSQAIKKQALNAGHYAQKNTGYTPKPGDLAIWTKTAATGHVGVVEKVYADGSFDVIEGNSSNRVKRNHYKSQSSVAPTFNGFVKMNEWVA